MLLFSYNKKSQFRPAADVFCHLMQLLKEFDNSSSSATKTTINC